MSRAQLRQYYERQGEESIGRGEGILCSEGTITEAVIGMVRARAEPLKTIIDVGCGANLTYDLELANAQRRITGVEFAGSFLRMAPRHPFISLVQASGDALPFKDSSYEGAICSETLEHVPNPESFIRELHRVLVPHGLLFLTLPNLWNAHRLLCMARKLRFKIELMPGHLREYTLSSVLDLIAPYFSPLSIHPVPFGHTGRGLGSRIDRWIKAGRLTSLSKSIAVTARVKK